MPFYIHTGYRLRRVHFNEDRQLRVAGWPERVHLLTRKRYHLVADAADPRRLKHGPELSKLIKSPKTRVNKNNHFRINNIKCKDAQFLSKTSSVKYVITEHKNPNELGNPIGNNKSIESPKKQPITTKTCKNKLSPTQKIIEINKSQELQTSQERKKLIKTKSLNNTSESQTVKLKPKSPAFVKVVQKIVTDSDSSDKTDSEIKELVITEEVVSILRRYIKKNKTNVDLHLFDTDVDYKTLVFYKISPLVRLERCPEIAKIIAIKTNKRKISKISIMPKKKYSKSKRKQTTWIHMTSSSEDSSNEIKSKKAPPTNDAMVFLPKDFRSTKRMKSLLSPKKDQPVSRITRQRALSTSTSEVNRNKGKESAKVPPSPSRATRKRIPVSDKENEVELRSVRPPRSATTSTQQRKPLKAETTNDQKEKECTKLWEKKRRPVNVPKRSSVAPGREYSSLEDHTIIAWLDKDQERQRLVSGNAVWQQLELEYYSLTKVRRSWHSLRNRYLRYILPSIWTLGLPSQQVQKLIANYGTGDLRQNKKRRNRNKPTSNSLLVLPTVKTAYGQRRRPKSPDAWEPTKNLDESLPLRPPKRTLRSSNGTAMHSPGTSSVGHSPTSKHRIHTMDHQSSPIIRKRPANDHLRSPNVGESSPKLRSQRSLNLGDSSRNRRRDRSPVRRDSSPMSYSDITKRFAMRLRSTPQNSGSSATTSPVVVNERALRQGRRLYNPKVTS